MKIETLSSEFVAAQPVLQRLEAAGFEAYFCWWRRTRHVTSKTDS